MLCCTDLGQIEVNSAPGQIGFPTVKKRVNRSFHIDRGPQLTAGYRSPLLKQP